VAHRIYVCPDCGRGGPGTGREVFCTHAGPHGYYEVRMVRYVPEAVAAELAEALVDNETEQSLAALRRYREAREA
jgi:hypothetical protein